LGDKQAVLVVIPESCMDVTNAYKAAALTTSASKAANVTEATFYLYSAVSGAKMWAWLHFSLAPARLGAILCGCAAAPAPFWAKPTGARGSVG